MELLQLQAFVSLAQTLHMPSTAQKLYTSQSYVSKLLSSLEAELGVRLFDRVGRGLVLTEHGKLFYDYAVDAIRLINNGMMAVKSTRNQILGSVNIGCYAFSPILYPCIQDFAHRNPLVNFYLSEVKQPDTHILVSNTDIILTTAESGSPHYNLDRYFPVYKELREEGFCAVLSRKLCCLPPSQKEVTLSDLADYPLIENAPSPFYSNLVVKDEGTSSEGASAINDIFPKHRIGYTTNDFFSKVLLIDDGLGLGIFPEVCVPYILRIAPDLQILSLADFTARRRILAARKDLNQMTSAAQKFWEHLLRFYDSADTTDTDNV